MSICVSSRLLTLPLLGLFLFAACSASKPDRGDTLSSNASPAGDTVGVPANALPPALTKYLDSGGFNPDGYYMIRALTIDGRKIGSLELSTVEMVDSTGKLRERPTLLQPPVGFLTVSEPNSPSESKYPCIVGVVAPDSLSLRCVATPVGEVAINGHFLDKGDFSDKFAETSTVLLVGRVVITNGGRPPMMLCIVLVITRATDCWTVAGQLGGSPKTPLHHSPTNSALSPCGINTL